MYLKELLKAIPSYDKIQVFDTQNPSLLYYEGEPVFIKHSVTDEFLKNCRVDFLEIDYDGEDAYLAIGVFKNTFTTDYLKDMRKSIDRLSEILDEWGIKSEDEGN